MEPTRDKDIIDDLDKYPRVATLTESQPAPIVDEVSNVLSYVGYAPLGTKVTEAKWKVLRVSKTGNVTTTEYAGGLMLYNQIWNDRATLTYTR
jgi:hypothetical protein